MNERLKTVGKSIPMIDSLEKVIGTAKYAADIQLPDMLYAKILGSPHLHAKIRKIDTTKAETHPLVKATITYKDVPQITIGSEMTRGKLVLDPHLRYVGDGVAAVAAETEEAAEEALKLVNVEYEVLPAVVDPIEAAKNDAPKLYPEGNISNPQAKPFVLKWGNIDQAFKEADVVVEGTFKTPMVVHTPLEPRACVVKWEGEKLIAWISTSAPHLCKDNFARFFNLPVGNIRIISNFVGGAFGAKYVDEYHFMAALLAKKAGRPVKLEYTRQDEHTIGCRRYSSIANVKLGAKHDGTLCAFDFECFYDVGAKGNPVGGSALFWESMPYVYRFKNAGLKAWDVNTNLITANPMRSVPYPAFHFAVDQLLDMIAEKLNMSPMEIRLKNTRRTGESLEPFGAELSDYHIEECLENAAEVIKWNKKWKGWVKPEVSNHKSRGIGLATGMHWCNFVPETTSAIVKVETSGFATLIIGTQDIGTGSKTTLCQIVAEVLGLSMQDVSVQTGDTGFTPYDHGACASRTMYCGGKAAKGAAEDARKKILEKATPILGVKVEELDLHDKKVYVKDDPENYVPVPELLTTSIVGLCSPEMPEQAAPGREKVKVGGACAHAAEVEVDLETGEVTVLNYVAVHDLGKAINPLIVQNQIYGGVIQGLGQALSEELIFDQEKSEIANPDYADYKIMTIADVPPIQPIILETSEPTGPFGAKGVGEAGVFIVPAIIANAIYQAIGERVKELPITPEKILKLLRKSSHGRG